MTVEKRVFVGGLFPGVQKKDLSERFSQFGDVKDVEVKVKNNTDGTVHNTFAYVTLQTSEEKLQKCFSVYNRAKWKGSEMKLELAKESFLHRLMKERKTGEQQTTDTDQVTTSDRVTTENESFTVKGAVPGTQVPGKNNWVVGKYGRVLPIVHVKDKRKRHIVKVDPSKFCHNVKKFKADVAEAEDQMNSEELTWDLGREEKDIDRRRKGEFPHWKPAKKVETSPALTTFPSKMASENDNFEFEVVPVDSHGNKVKRKSSMTSKNNKYSFHQEGRLKKTPKENKSRKSLDPESKLGRLKNLRLRVSCGKKDSFTDNDDEVLTINRSQLSRNKD